MERYRQRCAYRACPYETDFRLHFLFPSQNKKAFSDTVQEGFLESILAYILPSRSCPIQATYFLKVHRNLTARLRRVDRHYYYTSFSNIVKLTLVAKDFPVSSSATKSLRGVRLWRTTKQSSGTL
jgi:hypothetical protein